uniref:TniB NTP-binding protein n=1 Tax=Rheinheimera sp. BAL341 TaxID=1708203 RepID=A0A486XX10_9GAMM
MSDLNHVHPDFRHIVGLSNAERIMFINEKRWIGYEKVQLVLDTLQNLMNIPKRTRMPNLLIVADSNNGKSTAIERFKEVYGQAYINDEMDPVKPVIVAESPPSADEKGLLVSILEQFYTPYRATDNAVKLRYQVIHLCRTCHTQILIVDEFHSLLAGTAAKQREVMNVLKFLCNELKIPIVGVGTREAIRALHTDPQHASRFDVITLPNWELDKSFQKLLAAFEKVLPLKHESKLHLPETATLLHTISEGNIGNLHTLLRACAIKAIQSGEERITQGIIQEHKWLRPTRGIREVQL